LNAGPVQLRTFNADVQGNRGSVGVHAVLDRLRIPGPKPDLFESVPVDLRADVKLDDPGRPVTFVVSHPLVAAQGKATTAGELSAALTIKATSLAPFAALGGVDLKGHTTFDANIAVGDQGTKVELTGVVGVTGGAAPVPALIGNGARLCVGEVPEEDVTIERAQLDGKARLSADGSVKRRIVDLVEGDAVRSRRSRRPSPARWKRTVVFKAHKTI
jgi:translocation and assembly module TamB